MTIHSPPRSSPLHSTGDADDVTTDIGAGITGRIGDTKVRVGKPGYIDPAGLTADVEHLQAAGATVVLVERNGDTIGAIALRDELRPEAADVVARLRRHHRLHIAMLTGDQHRTANAIGAAAGIDDYAANCSPTTNSPPSNNSAPTAPSR